MCELAKKLTLHKLLTDISLCTKSESE